MPNPFAEAALTALESPAVQQPLEAAIAAGEVGLQQIVDSTIANAKGSGAIGLIINAAKGGFENAVNAEFAKLPPAAIAAYLTNLAKDELVKLGG